MSLPPSALLGRLQAFLPELKEANLLTEKLAKEGKLEVLDTNLEAAGTDEQKEEDAEATNEEEEDEEEAGRAGQGGEGSAPPKTIQLVRRRRLQRAQHFLCNGSAFFGPFLVPCLWLISIGLLVQPNGGLGLFLARRYITK